MNTMKQAKTMGRVPSSLSAVTTTPIAHRRLLGCPSPAHPRSQQRFCGSPERSDGAPADEAQPAPSVRSAAGSSTGSSRRASVPLATLGAATCWLTWGVAAATAGPEAVTAATLGPLESLLLFMSAAGFFVLFGGVTGQMSFLDNLNRRITSHSGTSTSGTSTSGTSSTNSSSTSSGGSPVFPASSFDPPLMGTGLTGTTQEHVRSYVDMTAGQGHNPDVMALRNRALATAASYSVRVAIKESQPRIRLMLDQLVQQARCQQHNALTSQGGPLPTQGPPNTGELLPTQGPASSPSHALTQPQQQQQQQQPVSSAVQAGVASSEHEAGMREQERDQERAVRELVTGQLRHMGPCDWAVMTEADVDALQRTLMQAVGEQAAMEQLEALLAVVCESQEEEQAGHRGWWPLLPGGRALWGSARRSLAGKRGIRGGGAH